jgi:hypothetical protein
MSGEHWMRHRICVHPFRKLDQPDHNGHNLKTVYDHWHCVKTFDYPSRITKKWAWYIDYWLARTKVRFPRNYVSHRTCGYFPEDEADAEGIKKRQRSSAQAQITKVLNVMEMRRKELSTQLFQDELTDPIMKKARAKLEEKKFKLQQLLID